MKKPTLLPMLALTCGILAFVLRLLQFHTGFEADSGLPIPGNAAALALILLLAVLVPVYVLLARRLPREDPPGPAFPQDFTVSSSGQLFLPVAGALLMALSGLADLAEAVTGANLLSWFRAAADPYGTTAVAGSVFAGRAQLLLALLSLLSAAALFSAAAACRNPNRSRAFRETYLLIPPAALVIRLVLIYRLDSVNPALEAYYVELLALVCLTLGFYRLSSFAFQSGKTSRFALYACAAVTLCTAALADHSALLSSLLLYAGGAVSMLGYLLLRLSAAPNAPIDAS